MKKTRLFLISALALTMLILLTLVGCGSKSKVSSISLKEHDPNTAIEMLIGNFDYSAYTLLVSYDNETVEEFILTKEMISEADQFKFYQEGEHDITVSYLNKEYVFKISVKRSEFGSLTLPENNVFTYDGKEHKIEVDGDIPANATIIYPSGNSFVNAGTYDVSAIVSCDGYVTVKLSTTVKIEKAKYDMSNVKFDAKEFVYDGKSHSVEISGTLPEGVSSPTYTIDEKISSSAVNVGEYKVIAKFTNKDPNYEDIPDMETTLKITPAEYKIQDIDLVFKTDKGTIINGATKVYDGTQVIFDLNDYSKLSNKVSVFFSVYDKDGKLISNSNKLTNIINTGVYTVKVEFSLADGQNYQPIEPIVREFEITKNDYPPLENIQFISNHVTYNGNNHSIKIMGTLPDDVTVSYEYYLDDTLILDSDGNPAQSVIDAGRYTVKAVFSHPDENRGEIPSLSTILNIEKIKIDTFIFGFSIISAVEYNGLPYEPQFTTWQLANKTEFDILRYSPVTYYVFDEALEKYVEMSESEKPTEIGLYRCVMTMEILEEYQKNYILPDGNTTMIYSADFKIEKEKINIPTINFSDTSSIIYNGEAHIIEFTHNADLSLMTISTAYYKCVSDTGNYVELKNGELPINAGLYKFVIIATLIDSEHQTFSNGEVTKEFLLEFEILTKEIDVSAIVLNTTTVTYDENIQLSDLVYIPEHVKATLNLYLSDGTVTIDRNINIGKYRLEVIIEPENSNYSLSSNYNKTFYFEIIPQIIDVSNLTFDTNNFLYNGSAQKPALINLPAHVKTSTNLTACGFADDQKPMYGEAVNVGRYIIDIRIVSESSNYVLFDGTSEIFEITYSTEFTISGQELDFDTPINNGLQIPYKDSGYTTSNIGKALADEIFGDMSDNVSIVVSDIYRNGAERVSVADSTGRYSVICQVSVLYFIDDYDISRYNYTILHDGKRLSSFMIEIYFDII